MSGKQPPRRSIENLLQAFKLRPTMTPDAHNKSDARSTQAAIRSAVHRKPRQLPSPRSVRLPEGLDKDVTRYLEQNHINFNQLCTFALQQFVSQPQTLELLPVAQTSLSAESPSGLAQT